MGSAEETLIGAEQTCYGIQSGIVQGLFCPCKNVFEQTLLKMCHLQATAVNVRNPGLNAYHCSAQSAWRLWSMDFQVPQIMMKNKMDYDSQSCRFSEWFSGLLYTCQDRLTNICTIAMT
jgi:hypothetical protein